MKELVTVALHQQVHTRSIKHAPVNTHTDIEELGKIRWAKYADPNDINKDRQFSGAAN